MMTHSSSHVVGRTCLAPLIHELTARQRELGAHVGIAKGEDFAFLVDALSHHKLEHTVLVLRDSQIGDRTRGRIELGEVTTTSLSMEHRYNLHRWLLGLRDVEVTRTRVSDDADILGEVDRIHLSQRSCARDGLQNTHGHSHLHITLNGTGCMLLDKHRESRNQHRVELACHALCKAIVVRGYHTEFLVLHPLLEGNDILRHIPNLLNGATTLNVEGC